MSQLIKKISASICIVALIIIYSFRRRFIEFKLLIKQRVSFYKSSKLTANEIVRYSLFWIKILRISSCFTKSLVIRDMLLMAGFKPEIQIGILQNNNNFESHCWIKLGSFYTEDIKIRSRYKLIDADI